MLKPGQKRPITPVKTDLGNHSTDAWDSWRQRVHVSVVTPCADGSLNFTIKGGSDYGEFAYVSDVVQSKVSYVSGKLNGGDVILEIQGQKVAGYTRRDVVAWLNHCCRNGNPVVIKSVESGSVSKNLRQFLNTRFQKGSADHDLQNTIRDNLYLRTVPVTTRTPREGEVNGVDYTFLTPEEFTALENSGNLLESGIYEGNHYGTPKPSKEPPVSPPQSCSVSFNPDILGVALGSIFPGVHPSSEGKRKRNRSNVEAMAAKNMEPELIGGNILVGDDPVGGSRENMPTSAAPPNYYRDGDGMDSFRSDLGPLPQNWEKAFTERGEVYFIDHNSGTSHWLDPRLSKFQKKSLEECLDDELPYGWEKIDDPHYGTYYIDHVNRKTQYENPVIQAKQAAQDGSGFENSYFTRNPNELQGERIKTTLVKSSRGLGFTIVGGDDSEEEFLQIKSVVPNGPAWLDGKLLTGDVLVRVNETCVLGFTHHDMVSVFQSIAPGETVTLEVCRGYPLPFDPNDPNTEVVTTVAVNAPDSSSVNASSFKDREGSLKDNDYNFIQDLPHVHNGSDDVASSSVMSMPDLCSTEKVKSIQRPNSTDVLLGNPTTIEEFESFEKPEFLSIGIVKGAMGFGFTIADSAYGQKVKKILDRQRCKNLMEGDILVDINSINVRNMSHGEVVQVLKDCVRNQEATVTVQRGGLSSPAKNKLRMKEDSNVGKKSLYADTVTGLYRSKTPTAELYSTQQKEVIPNRPKTPLVDTRNRPKTPTLSVDHRPWSPSAGSESSKLEMNSEMNKCEENGLDENISSPIGSFDNCKTKFQYSNSCKPAGTESAISPLSSLSEHLNSTTLQNSGSLCSTSIDYARSRSPATDLDSDSHKQREIWNKDKDHFDYKTRDTFSDTPQSPSTISSNVIDTSLHGDRSRSAEYMRHYVSHPSYNGYNVGGRYDASYNYGYNDIPASDFVSHKDFMYPYNVFDMPGYSSKMQNVPGGLVPSTTGGYTMNKKKESTSFEHEQPHPSNLVRYASDLRWLSINPSVHVYPASPGVDWVETLVTLVRQESGFGFRIVGGTEEGSQVGAMVSIGHIVPGGAADLDGRLCTGDEIVSVDSQSVLSTSHHHVVQLMGKAAANGRVTLGIRRRISSQDVTSLAQSDVGYPYDVTVTRRENEGFGFVIISSVNKAGSTIGRIIEGSPAERCGQLHVGDRILAVNHIDIMNLYHGDIVNLIKDSGYTVTLTIGPPVDDTSSTASAPQREEEGLAEEEQYHAVELSRGTRGFGFSIRGGREFQNMPLFVLQIAENGPAALDGTLNIGDQIIEINGINTKTMTHAEAIEIIRNGGPTVRLLVRRGGKVPLSPQIGDTISSSPGNLNLQLKSILRPGSSLAQANGPVRHNSPCETGYWDSHS
ncbi:membrane-associated guanylate kinase, WW and PDZ domain-containing protein 1 isoform X3 [Bacillus rossius redtenbacheri]|uniref:membrane-associated guanylate kinase, WW and PDZ domain-containing protein 1 isoform X3 n=1 Tax=Bacillus rossius redtenbacheri TaxID=93214 RepID=UPI002FDEE1CF